MPVRESSKITPKLQSEPESVGCAGCSPLQEPHMLVCSTGGIAKFALRPLRTEGFFDVCFGNCETFGVD
ncbi:MAG: hypothetical protein IJV50_03210 [Lachnospiraceae bacterium]|nr:hypothetical protein [Lachnospiraceae bacterium]